MGSEEVLQGIDEAGQFHDQRGRGYGHWENVRGGHTEGRKVRDHYTVSHISISYARSLVILQTKCQDIPCLRLLYSIHAEVFHVRP